jgi:hypothetical protein
VYWKKLTSINENMVGITIALMRDIGCRVEAGKSLEVVDEMRLVVIAAGESDVHPLHSPSPDETQNLLEALNATEQLWRQPYFVAEKLNESPLTDADLIRHL